MQLRLHGTVIEITVDSLRLRQTCEQLVDPAFRCEAEPDLRLELRTAAQRPRQPASPPIFVDSKHRLPDGIGRLAVYPAPRAGRVLLYFAEGGVADVPLNDSREPHLVRADVHTQLLTYGRLEDLIWTAMAPLLRRRGSFLVHAFGARRDGEAALLVGPSGSGKTTTGLLMLEQGWELLGNDVVLLYREAGQIWAAPMPGHVTVSERTLALLPALAPLVAGRTPAIDGKWWLPSQHVHSGAYPPPAPVRGVFFPSVGDKERSIRLPETSAVGLVRLMEESVDRWDETMLPEHMALLQMLVEQADIWRLKLAPDVGRVVELI